MTDKREQEITAPPDLKVFRIGSSRKILSFVYLACLVAIFLPIAGLVGRIILFEWESNLTLFLFVPITIIIGLGIYWVIEDISGVVTIEHDLIRYKSVFKNRVLSFADVKGYRTYYDTAKTFSTGQIIVVYPIEHKGNEIEISKYIENQPVLLGFLAAHFVNLAMAEFVKERKDLFENPLYGRTLEERKRNLKLATNAAWIANILGGIVGGLLIFLSNPPAGLSLAAVLFVPLTYVLVPFFRGILYFNNKTGSQHPYVGFGVIVCCMGLLIRGVFDYISFYSLLAYTGQSWIYVSLLTLVMWGLLLSATSEFANNTSMDKANRGAFLFFLLMYSFGTFFITNRLLDNRPEEQVITAIVTNKSQNDDSYSITIEPIEQLTEAKLNVDEMLFNTSDVHTPVSIHIMHGRWGRPWFYVEKGK